MAAYDELVLAGFVVTWVTHRQQKRFSILVNGELLQALPALPNIQVSYNLMPTAKLQPCPEIDFGFSFADLDAIHDTLHNTMNETHVLNNITFPVASLSDGRRTVIIYGVEFKQGPTVATKGCGRSTKHRRLADDTILVYRTVSDNKCYAFSRDNKSALQGCPWVISEEAVESQQIRTSLQARGITACHCA